jgi:hypothetical protein
MNQELLPASVKTCLDWKPRSGYDLPMEGHVNCDITNSCFAKCGYANDLVESLHGLHLKPVLGNQRILIPHHTVIDSFRRGSNLIRSNSDRLIAIKYTETLIRLLSYIKKTLM